MRAYGRARRRNRAALGTAGYWRSRDLGDPTFGQPFGPIGAPFSPRLIRVYQPGRDPCGSVKSKRKLVLSTLDTLSRECSWKLNLLSLCMWTPDVRACRPHVLAD
jgi:hypothetical protein